MNDRFEDERRGAPRFSTEGRLSGELPLDLDSDVIQISVGGMMLELTLPLAVSSRHRFTLALEGRELELEGVVRNCAPLPEQKESPRFRIGVAFVNLSSEQTKVLERFVRSKLGD